MFMGNFKMTVSTHPNSKLDLKEDIELIKVALLYGDNVTLKSMKADLIYKALDYKKQEKFLDKMQYLRNLAYLAKSDMAMDIEAFILKYRELTRKNLDDRKRGLLKLKIDNEFSKPWELIEKGVLSSINIDDINSIEKLMETDRLELVRYNTSISRVHHDDSYLMEYLKSIEETLSQYNNYPLFDSKISKFVNLGIKEGKLNVTNATQEKIKHSSLTITMLNNLPSFNKAEIDEVIDIRSELERYLIRFRSAVVKYTDLIEVDIT